MRYLSVCSGIEAASVAWHPLGWTPVAFSEIEPFPCAVLAHHYPSVPNWGDMTKYQEWPDAAIDVLVGGTPCQSFSVAGLRKGLDDPRGNLMLTYGAIAARYRPEWLVWENVPGVLSSNGGRDFGAFLGMLAELGYGFAYRVLDAQYFGLAQRRKRVFVVASARGWQRAAAVLFERHSLSGHPAPSREAGQVAPTIPSRSSAGGGLGTDFDCDGGVIAHSLRGEGFDASEDGTGRGTPIVPVAVDCYNVAIDGPATHTLRAGNGNENGGVPAVMVPVAFDTTQITSAANYSNPKPGDPCHPLAAGAHPPVITCSEPYTLAIRGRGGQPTLEVRDDGTANALLTPSGGRAGIGVGAVAVHGFDARQSDVLQYGPISGPMDTGIPGPAALVGMQVRRLTPKECARLQGFPDHYLDITYRGKPAADGPKYKALGNSMAVPCMAWIGRRIAAVAQIKQQEAA